MKVYICQQELNAQYWEGGQHEVLMHQVRCGGKDRVRNRDCLGYGAQVPLIVGCHFI